MADDRHRIAQGQAIDAAKLRAVRRGFDDSTSRLLGHLKTVSDYLADGAPLPMPADVTQALAMAPDRCNDCYAQLAIVVAILGRASIPSRHLRDPE